MSRMPTFFLPHGGGPCFFIDWDPADAWDKLAAYLGKIPEIVGQKPKAILMISGHWEEDQIQIQSNAAPEMLYDYYGFPEHTYALKYPAPGNPELASRVIDLLGERGYKVTANLERGFDHGVFIPLMKTYPDADIPVVQLSLRSDLDAQAHIDMGKALEPLRDEGVLILGSGNTFHNMTALRAGKLSKGKGEPAGQDFDQWLSKAVTDPDPDKRNALLAKWAEAPGGKNAHPREEHLIPLHVVAGAAGSDIGVKTLEDHVMGAVESAFQFG